MHKQPPPQRAKLSNAQFFCEKLHPTACVLSTATWRHSAASSEYPLGGRGVRSAAKCWSACTRLEWSRGRSFKSALSSALLHEGQFRALRRGRALGTACGWRASQSVTSGGL